MILGLELRFETDDASDLAEMLRLIAERLEEDGVIACPVRRGEEVVGRIVAEGSP